MKEQIILGIKRWLHYRGFIIERIPDQKKLDEELKLVDEAGKRHLLKRLTSNMRLANNHKRYNSLLKRYVPEWSLNVSSTEFVGSGIGEYSFNTFRKVYFEDRWLFEKVYFNNTADLARVKWFYQHIYPLLREYINITKLHNVIKGELFTIVYFEFTELTPLPEKDAQNLFLNFSKILFKVSNTWPICEICRNSPFFLKDYRSHFGYKRNIGLAAKVVIELSDGRLSAKALEEVVDLQPLVLTHGDIQRTNLYADNYLIDWDSFGFFPMGYESACILFERSDIVEFAQLQNILTENYQSVVDDHLWVKFQLCCFYFYFVFIAIKEASPEIIRLKKDVFDRIEHLYEAVKCIDQSYDETSRRKKNET